MVKRKKKKNQLIKIPSTKAIKSSSWALWVVFGVGTLMFFPGLKDAFRLPKMLFFQLTSMISLTLLAFETKVDRTAAPPWRSSAARAILPLVLVATLTWLTTAHRVHVAAVLPNLWIGALCLVGWNYWLSVRRLEDILLFLRWPALVMFVIGFLQFTGLYQPFEFARLKMDRRFSVTSLAGNTGDLAAFFVLISVLALWRLRRSQGRQRGGWIVIYLLMAAGVAMTQTMTAIAALVISTLVFWSLAGLSRRRFIGIVATVGVFLMAAVMLVGPLRTRVNRKVTQVQNGEVNRLLTGRLDAWRAAVEMGADHPALGVGQGAFRAEYIRYRQKHLDQGIKLFNEHLFVTFDHAHNEILNLWAECGLLGLLALGWALFCFLKAVTGLADPLDRAMAWSMTGAVAVLSAAEFPWHVALLAFPIFLFLAWVFKERSLLPAEGVQP